MMTLAAVCVAATMNAQGYIGGSLNFNYDKQDNVSNTKFGIQPEIGYNLDDKLAVGIVLGFATGNSKEDYEDVVNGNTVTLTRENKTSNFTINPYLRYTFAKFDKVNLFVDGGIFYTFDKLGEADSQKYNEFGVNIKPGVAVNLNDKLSFVSHFGLLQYSNKKSKADGAKAKNAFDLNLHSAVSFGLYYNF